MHNNRVHDNIVTDTIPDASAPQKVSEGGGGKFHLLEGLPGVVSKLLLHDPANN